MGVVPLKTTVNEVIVEVSEGGRMKKFRFPIRDEDGELMTHRLKRLLDGRISSRYSCGPVSDRHFVGMVWESPYTILREFIEERRRLQAQLNQLEGRNGLVFEPEIVCGQTVSNDLITRMIRNELKLRDSLRKRIRECGEMS